MAAPQATVFLSYRRDISAFMARAVFQDLRQHGYDVFMDVESLDSGQFEAIILAQIRARAHFLVILTHGSLDRCQEPDDWLRREIEYAMEMGRNVVPILVNDFRLDDNARVFLTGRLSDLPRYQGLRLPHDYFEAAMERLRTRFLQRPGQGDITPAPPQDTPVVQQTIEEAAHQPVPTKQELSAEYYFNQGYALHDNSDDEIAFYTEAIRLNPQHTDAYHNRGAVRRAQGDFAGAITDYCQAIALDPSNVAVSIAMVKSLPEQQQGYAAERVLASVEQIADPISRNESLNFIKSALEVQSETKEDREDLSKLRDAQKNDFAAKDSKTGFAATQSRLMYLLARKSDLELEIQFVTQHRMYLANQVSGLFTQSAALQEGGRAQEILEARIRHMQQVDKQLESQIHRIKTSRDSVAREIVAARRIGTENIKDSYGLMGQQGNPSKGS